MAFLDNSGDIILDAVLTDAGRQRMAKGNFKIVKFALGDDEINYELFNSNHPSGSAYYDLEVMQSPVLEAFTNNTASMKSRLMSIPRTNLLYLPVLKVNQVHKGASETPKSKMAGGSRNTESANMFVVACSEATETQLVSEEAGVQFGTRTDDTSRNVILVDQGLDTSGDPPITSAMDSSLIETQYIIQIDNRLGKIHDASNVQQAISFVDDDDIATYYFGEGTGAVIERISAPAVDVNGGLDNWRSENTPFNGPLGTRLRFKIKASLELKSSTSLFTKLGGSSTVVVQGPAQQATCLYIDSTVRITGVTTGFSIDLPVRFVRQQ